MANKITYLNGIRLHRTIVAGIHSVISRQDYLNKINVFPVPDGDTGTNMAFTLSAIMEGTAGKVNSRADDTLTLIADSALDGARGNSGVILAQFFQGMSDGVSDVRRMEPHHFSNAIKFGSDYAREALSEPREGTILTVLTDFSNELVRLIDNGVDDFIILLEGGIKVAEESLANTPNLLPILKKSGVVDAGGQGFVDFLHGINKFIKDGSIKEINMELPEIFNSEDPVANTDISHENLKFQFCTECLIDGDDINRKKLREELMLIGDSLIVAGPKNKAKIHIHVNDPAEMFSICEKYGTISGQKADDMLQQQTLAHGEKQNNVAIVTDSGADIPMELVKDVHVVPVRYSFGNKGFIDKVSQTATEFYEELRTNPNHPQTSQPTPGDFRRQYQFLSTHYKSIISIHMPKTVSGTFQSAENAAKRIPASSVTVMDAMNLSVAQGLLVIHASKLAKENAPHDKIITEINNTRSKIQLFAGLKDLSYIVKGGRIPKFVKTIADILHIRPILAVDGTGKLGPSGILYGKKNIAQKLGKVVLNKLDNQKEYIISVGHCYCEEEGKKLLDSLTSSGHNIKTSYLLEVGGALGVHAGPGALVVGAQEVQS